MYDIVDEGAWTIDKLYELSSGVYSDENSDNQADSYYVNAHTDMPSCLIELGFLTADEDNINFDTHLEEYAAAIARGIVELGTDEDLYQPAALQ